MHHTYSLIQLDQELQAANWDPFTQLDLPMPTIYSRGFNTPEAKKAYRTLAKKFHPDKVKRLPLEEQDEAKKRWLNIAKAYETLTDEQKF